MRKSALGYTWVTLEKEFAGYPQIKSIRCLLCLRYRILVSAVSSYWLPSDCSLIRRKQTGQGISINDKMGHSGDGFDSTYAIVHLLGQTPLELSNTKLPGADCLIAGGDQDYPDAIRDDCKCVRKCPPKAEVTGSNPVGCANDFNYLDVYFAPQKVPCPENVRRICSREVP